MKSHVIFLQTIILASAILSGTLTSCKKTEISDIKDRLTDLENQVLTLKSVPEQVASITATVFSLRDVQNDIKTQVSVLNDSSANYAAQLALLQSKLEVLDPKDMSGRILALEEKMTEATVLLAFMTAVDSLLTDRIAELELLTDILPTKGWVSANFATLEAQAATAATLSRVQSELSAVQARLPEGTMTVTEAIAAASTEVKGWVSDSLDQYWTAGVIEGKLVAMKAELDERTDSLDEALSLSIEAAEAGIAQLNSALAAAKEEIKAAYEDAISESADSLNGKISVNAAAIAKADADIDALDGRVSKLETDVNDLKDRMIAAESRLDKLETMVQSVVFVPGHSGGCAVLETSNSLTLDYTVMPAGALSNIKNLWQKNKETLTVKCVDVLTRSDSPYALEITGVVFNENKGLLTITVSLPDEIRKIIASADRTIAVSLAINTGIAVISSSFTDVVDGTGQPMNLSVFESANCYIVSKAGEYKFDATAKGNGTSGEIHPVKAEVLWETFGTAETPAVGDLVRDVILVGNNVYFTAGGKKGNALIAVEDEHNAILWSWHIWLTDTPAEQSYKNVPKKMMDRNLGATSARKGAAGSLGLMYQWGRKDPFLGACGISSGTEAAHTGVFKNTDVLKTPEETVQIPTTFISPSVSDDWTSTPDKYLWKSSSVTVKTIYDPCPPSWRVSDGGSSGVWSKAGFIEGVGKWEDSCFGKSFPLADPNGSTWYPAAGQRSDNSLSFVGNTGYYWSCTPDDDNNAKAYALHFGAPTMVAPEISAQRKFGRPVRCIRE